jgi:Ca-activated chloride channel family protein
MPRGDDHLRMTKHATALASLVAGVLIASLQAQPPDGQRGATPPDAFRFKSGVELVNVTATVSDSSGRFVSGLQAGDFRVYEDGRPVQIAQFSAQRVPVSLGIAIDTSGSMAGQKIHDAEDALNRFVNDLLDKDDEVFIYRFSNVPVLMQDWTTDRQLLGRALGRLVPNGGTALYDTVAEAIPMAAEGHNQKKALVLISDGNDTSSRTTVSDLRGLIHQSEVLVYAIGIDGSSETPSYRRPPLTYPPRRPIPFPLPFPGRRGRFPSFFVPQAGAWRRMGDDRVNVDALRELTDDSGGRTEVVRDSQDLNPATAAIADELSKQYYLAYESSDVHDGRWHAIRVEVPDHHYIVRARKGYVAS